MKKENKNLVENILLALSFTFTFWSVFLINYYINPNEVGSNNKINILLFFLFVGEIMSFIVLRNSKSVIKKILAGITVLPLLVWFIEIGCLYYVLKGLH